MLFSLATIESSTFIEGLSSVSLGLSLKPLLNAILFNYTFSVGLDVNFLSCSLRPIDYRFVDSAFSEGYFSIVAGCSIILSSLAALI